MLKLICVVALAASLSGCIVAPPYGYAPAPAPVYGYAPGYYAAPSVDVGIGFGGYGHGWHR